METLVKKVLKASFIRYIVVGATGFIIDIGMTYLLRDGLGVNQYIANLFGVTLAIINNFVLNKYWTFEDKSRNIGKQLVRYIIISILGIISNILLVWTFYGLLLLNFYGSKILAIVLIVFWNFYANRAITFSKRLDK